MIRRKFVAVAGQQAFVTNTSNEAYDKALASHPDEKGVIVHYLSPEKGMRIYANRRDLGQML